MRIKTRALGALAGLFSLVALAGATQAADRPYTEGPVSTVSSIRTAPGMFQTYMKYLSTTYKSLMEEQKKAGIILDYAIYQTTPRDADDPDLYLVVTYKDMAALDGLADRTEAIQAKLIGTQDQRDAAAIDREKMRRPVGQQMMRQLILK